MMKFKQGFVTFALIAATAIIPACGAVEVEAKTKDLTNYELMKQTVRENYGDKEIKLVDGNGDEDRYWEIILHRKNKDYVVVEKVVSVGDGTDHGWYDTESGGHYIIGYNKTTRSGRKVVSYIIWNPENNQVDDVAYVVDHKKVRG